LTLDLVVVKQKMGWELQYGLQVCPVWPSTARTLDRLLLQPGYPVHVYVLVQAIYQGGLVTACFPKYYVLQQIYLARKALAAVYYPGAIKLQSKRGYYLQEKEVPHKEITCNSVLGRVNSYAGGP
jgi:hypothetical protein